MAAIAELAQEVFDFPSSQIRFRVIERHRSMQPTLRGLEPEARLVQVAKKMHRVTEQACEGNDFA